MPNFWCLSARESSVRCACQWSKWACISFRVRLPCHRWHLFNSTSEFHSQESFIWYQLAPRSDRASRNMVSISFMVIFQKQFIISSPHQQSDPLNGAFSLSRCGKWAYFVEIWDETKVNYFRKLVQCKFKILDYPTDINYLTQTVELRIHFVGVICEFPPHLVNCFDELYNVMIGDIFQVFFLYTYWIWSSRSNSSFKCIEVRSFNVKLFV